MKKYIIPIIIPYSREKEDWIFDNQKIMNNHQQKFTNETLENIIEEHLKKIEEKFFIEVAFLGSSFTNLDIEYQEQLLKIVYKYMKEGKINGIRVTARPDNIDKKEIKILRKYKVKTIELEVHSTNDYILKRIGMNYNFQDIKKASKMIKMNGFKLGHQMMIGLPDSTKSDDINTAKNLIKLKTKIVSINPVLVIKDTPLEKEFNQKKYKPLAVVQALETCKELVKIFNEKHIEIIAIGFEPLDNEIGQEIFSEKVISGPFHPAFRQLVESSLWYDAIVNKIKKLNAKVMKVEVTVNPLDANNVIGYKNENIEKLKNTYDVDLIVTPNESIKQGKSKIVI